MATECRDTSLNTRASIIHVESIDKFHAYPSIVLFIYLDIFELSRRLN